jgi:hypothetical protein
MTSKAVRDFLAKAGSKGGKAGVGESKRRDQDDPDYYKRISAKAAAARKAKRVTGRCCPECGKPAGPKDPGYGQRLTIFGRSGYWHQRCIDKLRAAERKS